MPLQTIETRRLYRQIADQLREADRARRVRGRHAAAARARPRRAARRLAAVGARGADRARGRGPGRGAHGLGHLRARARSAPPRAPRCTMAESPLETIRARQLIEGELAAYAALHMKTRATRRPARRGRADGATRSPRGQHADRAATACSTCASPRPATTRCCCALVSELFDERHNPLFEQLGSHFENRAQLGHGDRPSTARCSTRSPHQAPQAAREAMALHLANSHDRFTASWPAEQPAAKTARKSRSAA